MSTACNPYGLLPTAPAFPGCPPEPPVQGCSAVWGSITGTLGNQLDLVEYIGNQLEAYTTTEDLEADYVNRTTDQDIDGVKNFNRPVISEGVQVGSAGALNSVMVGQWSLGFPITSSGNTLIGSEAGSSIGPGGGNNTAVGANSGPLTDSLDFTVALGHNAKATKSGQAVLGGPNTTETVLKGTIVVDSNGYEGSALPSVTMNTTVGSVVMEGGESLVVNNNKVTVFSLVFITVRTPLTDVNSFYVEVVNDGFFTIASALPPAEDTRIDFLVIN